MHSRCSSTSVHGLKIRLLLKKGCTVVACQQGCRLPFFCTLKKEGLMLPISKCAWTEHLECRSLRKRGIDLQHVQSRCMDWKWRKEGCICCRPPLKNDCRALRKGCRVDALQHNKGLKSWLSPFEERVYKCVVVALQGKECIDIRRPSTRVHRLKIWPSPFENMVQYFFLPSE